MKILNVKHWFDGISPVFQPEIVEVARVFDLCHPSKYDCASDMIRDIYLKTPECNLPTGIKASIQ